MVSKQPDATPARSAADERPEPKPLVMELRDVSFVPRGEGSLHLRHANLQLREGELQLVQLEPGLKCRDVASMMQGLRKPHEGDVLFQQRSWEAGHFEEHFRRRGRIGRVFEDQAWIENLNVIENVELASRHHGQPHAEVERQVRMWADRFEVPVAARDRPAFVDPAILQIYQWIRALLGQPALLILERPERGVTRSQLTRWIRAIDEVRRRGTAVLWFTDATDRLGTQSEPFRPPLRVHQGRFQAVSGVLTDE